MTTEIHRHNEVKLVSGEAYILDLGTQSSDSRETAVEWNFLLTNRKGRELVWFLKA